MASRNIRYVNYCGVPEEKIKDGICRECGCVCEIPEDRKIDERIWELALKYGAAPGGIFVKDVFIKRIGESEKSSRIPKYVKDYIGRQGQAE